MLILLKNRKLLLETHSEKFLIPKKNAYDHEENILETIDKKSVVVMKYCQNIQVVGYIPKRELALVSILASLTWCV